MMMKSLKGLIGFLAIFSLLTLVSAGDYVDWYAEPQGYNTYINGTGIMRMDQSYTFAINVSGSNVSTVTISGNDMVNITGVSSSAGDWSVTLLPEKVAEFQNNCTYTPFTITMTNYNSTGSAFTNTTTQANLTFIPCIESRTAVSTYAVTDIDTGVLTVPDLTLTNSVMWLRGIAYNVTNLSCNYDCTNSLFCKTSRAFTGGVAESEYCTLEVNRSATDAGTIGIDVGVSWSPIAPSNIPAAILGSLTIIIASYAVVRVRRRGGVKQP